MSRRRDSAGQVSASLGRAYERRVPRGDGGIVMPGSDHMAVDAGVVIAGLRAGNGIEFLHGPVQIPRVGEASLAF